jgi:dolichol-phosphate mannosyltransferase
VRAVIALQPGRRLGLLSIVTPAYNEAANLPALYARLVSVLAPQRVAWEWIVVDDHSRDETFAIVKWLAGRDPRVKGVRLARNQGPHPAIACGLADARGDAAAVLAADLQDPPEVLPRLIECWADGAQVVWAVRKDRQDQALRDRLLARLFYWLLRRTTEVGGLPASGADCFLIDRLAIDAIGSSIERYTNLPLLIARTAFRQASVPYSKERRVRGRSGWSTLRKLELAIHTLTVFNSRPGRLLRLLGVAIGALDEPRGRPRNIVEARTTAARGA